MLLAVLQLHHLSFLAHCGHFHACKVEKDSFFEKLVNLTDEERLDPTVAGGIKRSLEAIIEAGAHERLHRSACEQEVERTTLNDDDPRSVLKLVETAYARCLIAKVSTLTEVINILFLLLLMIFIQSRRKRIHTRKRCRI